MIILKRKNITNILKVTSVNNVTHYNLSTLNSIYLGVSGKSIQSTNKIDLRLTIINRLLYANNVVKQLNQYKAYMFPDNEYKLQLLYCKHCGNIAIPKFILEETKDYGELHYDQLFNPLVVIKQVECTHCGSLIDLDDVLTTRGIYPIGLYLNDGDDKIVISVMYANITFFYNKLQVSKFSKKIVINKKTRNSFFIYINNRKKFIRNVNYSQELMALFTSDFPVIYQRRLLSFIKTVVEKNLPKTRYVNDLKTKIDIALDNDKSDIYRYNYLKNHTDILCDLVRLFKNYYVHPNGIILLKKYNSNFLNRISKMQKNDIQDYIVNKMKYSTKRFRRLVLEHLYLYPVYNKASKLFSVDNSYRILNFIVGLIESKLKYPYDIDLLMDLLSEDKQLIQMVGENKIVDAIIDNSIYLVKDTIDMLKRIFTINNDFNTIKPLLRGNIREVHDSLSAYYQKIKSANIHITYSNYEKSLEDNINGFEFRLPEDTYKLIDVGNNMHMCVGSLYSDKAVEKKCTIVVVTYLNKYVACIEVKNNSIVQAKGPFNSRLKGDVFNSIIEWANKHKLNINTSDLIVETKFDKALVV